MQQPNKIFAQIEEQIKTYPVLLYMKGTPRRPMCGFSARVVQALEDCDVQFASVDVLNNPEIRANLPLYANWPTFPQLYVKGELIGGCDIVLEMHEKGELQPLLESAHQA